MPLSFTSVSRTVDGSLTNIGQLLPGLIVALLKLALIGVFFAYACAFVHELWGTGAWFQWPALIFVLLLGLLSLVLIGWAAAAGFRTEWKKLEAEREALEKQNPPTAAMNEQSVPLPPAPTLGSIWPFLALAALPIAVVILLHFGLGCNFTTGLSKATQDHITQLLNR